MKKVILIPDSFKGTLSSIEICDIMKEIIYKNFPDCLILSIPVADGGEGSVDCFLSALGGEKIYTKAKNPYFESMDSFYGLIEDGKVAVIEMASCAGLPLVENRKNPSKTTTYGVGELIMDAANKGCNKIILGLGGSSTNDGGCGAAAACGVKFLDKFNNEFIPVGETLKDIVKIDITKRHSILDNVEIITMCDIDNPMFGTMGAAYVFGPQKGADEVMVKQLDDGLRNLSNAIQQNLCLDVGDIKGAGAAGAMGAGMVAFFNSKLVMGIEVVLDTVKFDEKINECDMIFTGEGRIDSQSLRGKVIIGVSRIAKKKGINVVAVVGGADENIEQAYKEGVSSIFTINRLPQDFEKSRYKSKENLAFVMDNILKLIKISKK